jgi:dihydroorotase
MTPPLLIKNGRIIDPANTIDMKGSLLVKDKLIAWMGQGAPPEPDYVTIDAEGLIVCPGFIDLHCHLRQPGEEQKETIATGTRAAAKGGFTTVCCMPNTKPPLDSAEMIQWVRNAAKTDAVIRVLPIGAVTVGQMGEELADLGELEVAGACGFSDDGVPVASPELMRQALAYSREFGLPIIDHCENLFMTQEGQMNEGAAARELGLRGIPPQAEELIVKRDLDLARETGGHVHIAHVSTARSVEMLRAAKETRVPVTAEATPHHLTLTEETVREAGTLAKVNPPLRTEADVRALVQGLNDGVIDAVATDHAPHAAADKEGPFEEAAFGISGLETALGSLGVLVMKSEISLNTLIEALTIAPGRVLGYEKFGTLGVGLPADITIFDLHREWTVEPAKFVSKGKNTPLAGKQLRGRVMATVFEGTPVYLDDTMTIETGITS